MLLAIADIGSNTVKMSIFNEKGKVCGQHSLPVGLIGYLKNKKLSKEGIDRLIEALLFFKEEAAGRNAPLYPFATASLRLAENRDEVLNAVKERTGLAIDLVSGEEEAMLSLTGATQASGFALKDCLLFDMGGGSCEIIGAKEGRIETAISLPFGALALHKRFVKNILPTKKEVDAIQRYTRDMLHKTALTPGCTELYAVGGSAKAAAAFCETLRRHKSLSLPYRIPLKEVDRMLDMIVRASIDTKLALFASCPERVHTMPAGLAAYAALLRFFGADKLTVVKGGAREGYFLKLQKAGVLENHAAL